LTEPNQKNASSLISQLLDPTHSLLQPELDRVWLHSCQHSVYGGIAREPGAPPGKRPDLATTDLSVLTLLFPRRPSADVYHTYLALAALAIGGHPGLAELDVGWNVSRQVADRIRGVFGPGATAR